MSKKLLTLLIVLAMAMTSVNMLTAQDEEDSDVECEETVGEIIAFTPARSERYVNGLITGLQNEATNACYDITILENEFNQAQQDQQVQQQLAIGLEPDMWIWWPAEGAAGLGSLRDLASTDIPVLQINQLPTEEAEPFVIGYAGPDDALRARNAGLMMVELAEELGIEEANAIAVTYPVAYGGYPLSMEAFNEAIADSGITLIEESNEGFGSQNGYNGTAALLAQLQGEEFTFIYGMDDAILQGAIQALEEAGLTVGIDGSADVIAVGTVCNGDRQLFEEERQYGTTLQAPLLEGQLAIQVADEYLTTGEVEEFLNFTPNPAVLFNEWEEFTLEGFDGEEYTMNELCTWGVPEDEEEMDEESEDMDEEESEEESED
jgi:ribose transport system substrate-binding protein